jgi:hypothetical protein
MKTYKYLLFALIFSIAGAVQAQTVLKYQSHALQSGDNHHFKICENVKPGSSGANQIWDFSDLVDQEDLVSHMLIASDQDDANNFPASNVVIEEFGNNFFFEVEDNIVKQYGLQTKSNSIIKYDEPFVKMVFPFSYGDTYQGPFSGQIINGTYTNSVTGNYNLEADAYGTIILPGDITVKDVIRLKTTRTMSYGNCGASTSITYRWYCDNVRYPLLTIITHVSGKQEKTTRTAYYADLDEIKDKNEQPKEGGSFVKGQKINLNVYPNPFSKEANLKYKLKKQANVVIKLYNNKGKEVLTVVDQKQEKGQYTEVITEKSSDLPAGLYTLKAVVDNEVITKQIIKIK